jgi:hypothetical protein
LTPDEGKKRGIGVIRCPLLFGPSVLVLETLTREKFQPLPTLFQTIN